MQQDQDRQELLERLKAEWKKLDRDETLEKEFADLVLGNRALQWFFGWLLQQADEISIQLVRSCDLVDDASRSEYINRRARVIGYQLAVDKSLEVVNDVHSKRKS